MGHPSIKAVIFKLPLSSNVASVLVVAAGLLQNLSGIRIRTYAVGRNALNPQPLPPQVEGESRKMYV